MPELSSADREALPIPDRPYDGPVFEDAKDPAATFPPIEPLRPPAGAPNVLVVLIDDAGFGSSSAFGGPCRTPTAERLAGEGLKFTRFHTTALCSPTRAALLSGRNHHSVGMGGITEIATSAPGYSSVRPNTCAPLAETLKLNGYATAQFGKCHEVPVWETSPLGPFDSWPSGGGGFEYFYGFIGGETNQYYPAIYEGTTPVEPDRTPEEGYHFTEDMTDKAIKWIRQQKALMGDKPFFAYYAPGATHAPHHVRPEWSAKYKGEFDQGWDRLREETFARQKELGVIPPEAELTARPDEIPAWDDIPDDLKPVLARQMEVYAGFMEHTDHHVGRLVDALEDLGVLGDTLVYYIVGDNGASAEGDLHGMLQRADQPQRRRALQTTEFMAERIDKFGTPEAYNHYAVGWAHAMDTPYQWTKQVASHWGGTRNGTIVHWPNGFEARGEVRNQFHHVIDVAPTVLEAAGLPEPKTVHGVTQKPIEGVSMRYAFDDAGAAERHETQYFEMFCNRGIYHEGWTAVTRHSTPWVFVSGCAVRRRHVGALRHEHGLEPGARPRGGDAREAGGAEGAVPRGGAQVQRAPARRPPGRALQLRPRRAPDAHQGRLAAAVRRHGAPDRERGHQHQEQVARGDRRGDGPGRRRRGRDRGPGRRVRRLEPLRQGRPAQVRLQPVRRPPLRRRQRHGDPAGHPPGADGVHLRRRRPGQGRRRRALLDGAKTGEGRVEGTVPMIFSGDETCDVGSDTASPVSADYTSQGSRFTGTVEWVQIDISAAAEDLDHLITPEQRLKVAMTKQ